MSARSGQPWQKFTDARTGKEYYHNATTGDVSWKPPAGYVEKAVKVSKKHMVCGNWHRYWDKGTKMNYFVNMATNRTTWTAPGDWDDALAKPPQKRRSASKIEGSIPSNTKPSDTSGFFDQSSQSVPQNGVANGSSKKRNDSGSSDPGMPSTESAKDAEIRMLRERLAALEATSAPQQPAYQQPPPQPVAAPQQPAYHKPPPQHEPVHQDGDWNCLSCTYNNKKEHLQCSMCRAEKHRTVVTPHVTSAIDDPFNPAYNAQPPGSLPPPNPLEQQRSPPSKLPPPSPRKHLSPAPPQFGGLPQFNNDRGRSASRGLPPPPAGIPQEAPDVLSRSESVGAQRQRPPPPQRGRQQDQFGSLPRDFNMQSRQYDERKLDQADSRFFSVPVQPRKQSAALDIMSMFNAPAPLGTYTRTNTIRGMVGLQKLQNSPMPNFNPPPTKSPKSNESVESFLDDMFAGNVNLKASKGKPVSLPPGGGRLPPPRNLPRGASHIMSHELQAEIHQFKLGEYASEHFSKFRRQGLFSRQKQIPMTDLLKFQPTPLENPLLDLKRSLGTDAKKNFLNVLAFMDADTSKSRQMIASRIVVVGESKPLLRDEIYCQLCK